MEKVLICLLASTRAHQLTFPSFKRKVLDELNGDLALALTIDESYDYANPFWAAGPLPCSTISARLSTWPSAGCVRSATSQRSI
jgi:hypothetical protein